MTSVFICATHNKAIHDIALGTWGVCVFYGKEKGSENELTCFHA